VNKSRFASDYVMKMRFTIISASCSVLLLCTVLLASIPPFAEVYATNQVTVFRRVPIGYNNQTGAFTLTSSFINDGLASNPNGRLCASYDYFIFNAQAGQVLQGQVQTGSTGSKPVYYTVLNSPAQLNVFMGTTCGRGTWQIQQLMPPATISWTAPSDGQYALVLIVSGFYGGPLYFSP